MHVGFDFRIDPRQIRIDLCYNTAQSKQYCQAFLHDFAEQGREVKPSLTEDEYDEFATITAAKTVDMSWFALVSKANDTVLRETRQQEPHLAGFWTLKYSSNLKRCPGPVGAVTRVSHRYLVAKQTGN